MLDQTRFLEVMSTSCCLYSVFPTVPSFFFFLPSVHRHSFPPCRLDSHSAVLLLLSCSDSSDEEEARERERRKETKKVEEAADNDESLAVPEFEGLWGDDDGEASGGLEQRQAPSRPSMVDEASGRQKGENGEDEEGEYIGAGVLKRPDGTYRLPGLSKLEQSMMADARQLQKENLTKSQVVWGKEFKGAAFLPKPDEVVFKDFEVGKTYRFVVL